MPSPDSSLTAVVVSGGKQYRVAPGDRIVVDRVAAEPGSELTLERVLMVADGDDFKVGPKDLDGVTVVARVVSHPRGVKIDTLRYKSKKRVRVHRGSRAELTALEILEVGGKGRLEAKPAKATPEKKPRSRRAGKSEAAEPAASAEPTASAEPAPKRSRARKTAKAEGEADGS